MKIYLNKANLSLFAMVIEERGDGQIRRALPLQFEEWHDSRKLPRQPEATIGLDLEEGQHLIDQLWQLGYRPSRGVSSAGQDEAQKAHIADLRDILAKVLGALCTPRLT